MLRLDAWPAYIHDHRPVDLVASVAVLQAHGRYVSTTHVPLLLLIDPAVLPLVQDTLAHRVAAMTRQYPEIPQLRVTDNGVQRDLATQLLARMDSEIQAI